MRARLLLLIVAGCGGAGGGGRETCGMAESWAMYQRYEQDSASARPVVVDGITDAVDVTVGGMTCVRRRGGEVAWWTDPGRVRAMPLIGAARVVVTGSSATCAIAGTRIACFNHAAAADEPVIRPVLVSIAADDATELCVDDHAVGTGEALGYGSGVAVACAREPGRAAVCWSVAADRDGFVETEIRRDGLPRRRSHFTADCPDWRTASEPACMIDDVDAMAYDADADGALALGMEDLMGLGEPAAEDAESCFAPPALARVADPVAVAGSASHTCAVVESGAVSCWGDNDFGELGDDTKVSREAPATVVGIRAARAIAVGDRRSCAVLASGRVACWGIGAVTGATRPPPGAILILD